jgi:hypothetical protein
VTTGAFDGGDRFLEAPGQWRLPGRERSCRAHHGRPACGEPERERLADAARRAGHDRDPPFEFVGHGGRT